MNIYETIDLKRVINASGRMSTLGVSTQSEEVSNAMVEASKSYVVIDDLMDKAGEIISKYTGGEDSLVVSCASAGVAIAVAGIISKGKKSIIERLPDSSGLANEIVMLKGHVVQFGAPISTMIRIGGGVVKEVGMVNEVETIDVEEAINEKTAALLYVKSHHCIHKGMLELSEMIEIAHRHDLPLILDAAAEEDLKGNIALGADLVIYSGAKAMEAPTSGLITGEKEYIAYAKKQKYGIARPMKIGKEGIVGLLKAMELYAIKDEEQNIKNQLLKIDYLVSEINQINGLDARMISDEAGRKIYRCEIKVDEKLGKISIQTIVKELKLGNPQIYCRGEYINQGIIHIDPRPLVEGDKELIVTRLKEIMESNNEIL